MAAPTESTLVGQKFEIRRSNGDYVTATISANEISRGRYVGFRVIYEIDGKTYSKVIHPYQLLLDDPTSLENELLVKQVTNRRWMTSGFETDLGAIIGPHMYDGCCANLFGKIDGFSFFQRGMAIPGFGLSFSDTIEKYPALKECEELMTIINDLVNRTEKRFSGKNAFVEEADYEKWLEISQ